MTRSQSHLSCPVCKTSGCTPVARIQDIPLLCNFLYSSAREAQAAAKGEIELVLCSHCTHLYNRAFNPDIINYGPGYENSLHHSTSYRGYAVEQAKRLLNSYNLHGQRIVDIGCGKGEFLELFTRMGDCMATGFEPAAPPAMEEGAEGVRIIAENFSETYFDSNTKCYISRHVLEHLVDPGDFLKTIRLAMDDGKAVLFLEVPDGVYMLEQCSVWDLIYEHYSYFTPQSLRHLLGRSGFCCQEVQSGFGGQYLFVDAFPVPGDDKLDGPPEETAENNALSGLAGRFSHCLLNKNKKVDDLLKRQKELGRKIILWGAGSKGIALLNQLSDPDGVQYVVDINPEKQGKFIPGGGQLVVAPDFLKSFQPDMVLIMNSIYRDEIQNCLDDLQVPALIENL